MRQMTFNYSFLLYQDTFGNNVENVNGTWIYKNKKGMELGRHKNIYGLALRFSFI